MGNKRYIRFLLSICILTGLTVTPTKALAFGGLFRAIGRMFTGGPGRNCRLLDQGQLGAGFFDPFSNSLDPLGQFGVDPLNQFDQFGQFSVDPGALGSLNTLGGTGGFGGFGGFNGLGGFGGVGSSGNFTVFPGNLGAGNLGAGNFGGGSFGGGSFGGGIQAGTGLGDLIGADLGQIGQGSIVQPVLGCPFGSVPSGRRCVSRGRFGGIFTVNPILQCPQGSVSNGRFCISTGAQSGEIGAGGLGANGPLVGGLTPGQTNVGQLLAFTSPGLQAQPGVRLTENGRAFYFTRLVPVTLPDGRRVNQRIGFFGELDKNGRPIIDPATRDFKRLRIEDGKIRNVTDPAIAFQLAQEIRAGIKPIFKDHPRLSAFWDATKPEDIPTTWCPETNCQNLKRIGDEIVVATDKGWAPIGYKDDAIWTPKSLGATKVPLATLEKELHDVWKWQLKHGDTSNEKIARVYPSLRFEDAGAGKKKLVEWVDGNAHDWKEEGGRIFDYRNPDTLSEILDYLENNKAIAKTHTGQFGRIRSYYRKDRWKTPEDSAGKLSHLRILGGQPFEWSSDQKLRELKVDSDGRVSYVDNEMPPRETLSEFIRWKRWQIANNKFASTDDDTEKSKEEKKRQLAEAKGIVAYYHDEFEEEAVAKNKTPHAPSPDVPLPPPLPDDSAAPPFRPRKPAGDDAHAGGEGNRKKERPVAAKAPRLQQQSTDEFPGVGWAQIKTKDGKIVGHCSVTLLEGGVVAAPSSCLENGEQDIAELRFERDDGPVTVNIDLHNRDNFAFDTGENFIAYLRVDTDKLKGISPARWRLPNLNERVPLGEITLVQSNRDNRSQRSVTTGCTVIESDATKDKKPVYKIHAGNSDLGAAAYVKTDGGPVFLGIVSEVEGDNAYITPWTSRVNLDDFKARKNIRPKD